MVRRRGHARLRFPARLVRRFLAAGLPLMLMLLPLLASAAPGGVPATSDPPLMRQLPGPSPRQTVENFLASTDIAERQLRGAIHRGLAEPGWLFSSAQRQQARTAQRRLEQAIEVLNLSALPPALHPITGVGYMLMLRSLLLYDLAQQPDLVLPGPEEVVSRKIRSWTLPETPITLSLNQAQSGGNGVSEILPCQQCSENDFLFSPRTVAQVESDFNQIFGSDPARKHRYGGDLYVHWALLPGGALPPKLLLQLPRGWRDRLETSYAGQSLIQWLLLVLATAVALALVVVLLLRQRNLVQRLGEAHGPRPYWLRVGWLAPLLLLGPLWRWFCIDWLNLTGERAMTILVLAQLLQLAVILPVLYLLAEAAGQSVVWRRQRLADGGANWIRRKGAGQVLTLARVSALVAGLVVLIRSGHSLGLTSVTLLAMSSVPALALSLGTQQLIRDVSDGFSLFLDGQIKVGDRCSIATSKSGHIDGTVVSMGMRSLSLRLKNESLVSIPNSQVAGSLVTNHSMRGAEPLDLRLAIPPGDTAMLSDLQDRTQALLAQTVDLLRAEVHLDHGDGGWWLHISGSWAPEIPRDSLPGRLDGLILAFHGLIRSVESRPHQAG